MRTLALTTAVVYLTGYFITARLVFVRMDARERSDANMISAACVGLFWPVALLWLAIATYRGSGRHRAGRRQAVPVRDVEVRPW
jgi:uncharacterized membrane protein